MLNTTNTPIGNMLQAGPKVSEIRELFKNHGANAWSKLQQKYGDNYMLQGIWICSDPVWVERLLMQKIHTQNRSLSYKKRRDFVPLASGMLFMDGEDWQKRLVAVMPSFTRTDVEKYSQNMLSVLGRVWKEVNPGNIQDVYPFLVQINKQHLFEVGYGLDSESKKVMKLADAFINYKFYRMEPKHRVDLFGFQIKDIPALYRTWRSARTCRKLENQFITRLEELDESVMQQSTGKGLDWYRRLKSAGFSNAETALEMNHLYSAYNALDYVLTCALVELAKNPEWQQFLGDEWGKQKIESEGWTWDHWQKLPLMQSFIKEVLRCYPATMGVSRRLGEDISVGDRTLKEGQEVLIPLYPLHFHPDHWERPEQFDPKRWNQEPENPYTYIPFLKGSRHCIGRHLAEMNMMLVLGSFLERFRIKPTNDFPSINQFMMPRFEKEIAIEIELIEKSTSHK